MAERLITPQDFTTGAPPRIMGTEAEDHVGLSKYSEGLTKEEKKLQDHEAIFTLLSLENLEKAGIGARVNAVKSSESTSRWLLNGQRLYPDGEKKTLLLESCTAEQLGPKNALAGTLAGIRVVERLAQASELPVQIFRRSATVNAEGTVGKAGFHMNHTTPHEVASRIEHGEVGALYTHSATRLYTWEGMVSPDGFVLSQKGYANKLVQYRLRDNEASGFARLEDYSGDDSSPWGTFMAMATTSVLLRVLEHTSEKDLNKRLAQLQLANPHKAIQTASADKSLKEPLFLTDKRKLTAIEIQTELADIASEFSKRFTLPEDEQYAVDEWQRVCRDLTKAAETGDLFPLIDRIGWVGKKYGLEKKIGDKLDSTNYEAVLFDMKWDSYYPKEGGRLILPRKTGLTIVSDAQVEALVDHPPQDTRAVVRSSYLKDKTLSLGRIDWEILSIEAPGEKSGFQFIFSHPYQTEVQEEVM